MPHAISPLALGAKLDETWSPRVITALDDSYVKVAKIHGTFGWHSHPDEDELFMVIQGAMRIDLEHGSVALKQGELYVVPKGARHCPVAEQECLILLIEKKTTAHGGDSGNAKTRSIDEQLRALQ